MRFDFVGRAEGDVDAAAIGLPSGDTGGVPLVGVGDAAVVLFLVLVLGGVGRRVAAQPELLDELLASRRRSARRLKAVRSSSVMM